MLRFDGHVLQRRDDLLPLRALHRRPEDEQQQLVHLSERLLRGRLVANGQRVRKFDDDCLLKFILKERKIVIVKFSSQKIQISISS